MKETEHAFPRPSDLCCEVQRSVGEGLPVGSSLDIIPAGGAHPARTNSRVGIPPSLPGWKDLSSLLSQADGAHQDERKWEEKEYSGTLTSVFHFVFVIVPPLYIKGN